MLSRAVALIGFICCLTPAGCVPSEPIVEVTILLWLRPDSLVVTIPVCRAEVYVVDVTAADGVSSKFQRAQEAPSERRVVTLEFTDETLADGEISPDELTLKSVREGGVTRLTDVHSVFVEIDDGSVRLELDDVEFDSDGLATVSSMGSKSRPGTMSEDDLLTLQCQS